ncbi:MAG: ABC transporter permease [Actinomycetota bacterium]
MPTMRITWGVAARSLRLIPRLPSTFVPSLIMPVVFVVVFSGAFAGLTALPAFPTREMVDWFIPVAALMGCGFAGITTGMGVARDLEIGFYDRFLVSPAPRRALLGGAILAAVLRGLLPLALVLAVGALYGASVPGGVLGILSLIAAGLGLAACAGAWSVGIGLRFKTQQSAPLMQVGMFLGMFLSTLQMPLELLTGWLHTVATWNPITQVIDLARQGFVGNVGWETTWPGLAAVAGIFAVLIVFAARGMRAVVR